MVSYDELSGLFYNKNVLITGHTGFKGSWLSYILHQLGANIIGYAVNEPQNCKHFYYELGIKGLLKNDDHLNNIVDVNTLYDVMRRYEPEFVFHLAAQAIVSTSYEEPDETIKTNVMGTANMLEVLRKWDKKITAVIITSDKCYKNKERSLPYQEHEEMGGDDPYSASKGCAELIFHSYMVSYFKDDDEKHIASTRAGNVFGGGDWSKDRLIPDCVRDILTKGAVDIRMPAAVRPWTFVVEVLYGYILLAYKLCGDKKYQGSWNFASGETLTVLEVCNIFLDAFGYGVVNEGSSGSVGKESCLLLIDESKAKKELQWSLLYSVKDALRLTAMWYDAQSKGINMKMFTDRFMREYFSKIG